jgi:hypothetical protein
MGKIIISGPSIDCQTIIKEIVDFKTIEKRHESN